MEGKENLNLEKPLDELSSEGEGESEEESSGDETTDTVNGIPLKNSEKLLKYIRRDLNMLSDEDKVKRKFGLMNLYEIFVKQENKIEKHIMQEILPSIQKPLLKRFSDPVETWRELAILIIKQFFIQWDDLTITFPYIFPVLVEKLGAHDLDGTAALPDVMKPPPSQKPKMIVNPPEPSEEVRLKLAEIVTLMIKATISDCFRAYLDDLVTIICTLVQDPYGEVIREAWDAYYILWNNDTEILYHFTVIMGRSTFLALTHKHAKVRCAGLKALNAIMHCGTWKYTVDIFESLIGFRDPNVVPIKDFYEPSIKLNYFARFVVDRSTLVRETFYKTLANWLLKLEDRVDHEGRIIPYMLSALNDPNDDIKDLAFELLEEMGIDYEEREEQKIRDTKQYALEAAWTNNGEFVGLELPRPFKHRPRLGSRIVIRSYVRRYLKAIYRELSDWILENRARAAHLLQSLIIYAEDYIMQNLDHLLLSIYKAILEKEDMEVKVQLETSAKLLGRYCSPEAYMPFFFSALSGEYTSSWSQLGALKAFGCIIAGSIEVIPQQTNLQNVDHCIQKWFDAIEDHIIEPLDFELAEMLIETLTRMFDMILHKVEMDKISIPEFGKYERQVFHMLTAAFGVFNTHSLFSKESTEKNSELKNTCIKLFKDLGKLSNIANGNEHEDGTHILSKWLPVSFYNISTSEVWEWTFQEQKLRVFNGFLNHMEIEHSNAILDDKLVTIDKEEREAHQERIEKYASQKAEEERTRYNRHLNEHVQQKERLKAIEEVKEEDVDKENEDPGEPVVAEEVIDTSKKTADPPKNPYMKSPTGQEEDKAGQLDENFDDFYCPSTTVFNMATNTIIKLFEHPSFELLKYALSKLPEVIRLSEAEKSTRSGNVFRILSASMCIKLKGRDRRLEFNQAILHQLNIIKRDCWVEIAKANCNDLYVFLNHLRVFYDNYNLKVRQGAVTVMRYFMQEYVEFLDKNPEERSHILKENTFLHQLFKDLFVLSTEAVEDIRLMATDTLSLIIDQFLPQSPIVKGDAYNDDLKEFRKNLSKTFDSAEKWGRMDEYSRLEAEMVKHVFDDPGLFMQGVVKLAIDETHGANRDTLVEIIIKMNEKLPFTVINDFKRANALGMFKRIELMKGIVAAP